MNQEQKWEAKINDTVYTATDLTEIPKLETERLEGQPSIGGDHKINNRLSSLVGHVEYMHSPGQRASQATLRRKLMVRRLYDWMLEQGVGLFNLEGWVSDGQHIALNMQSHMSPQAYLKWGHFKIVESPVVEHMGIYSSNEPTVMIYADVYLIDREHLKKYPKPSYTEDPVAYEVWRMPYVLFQTAVEVLL